MADQRTVAPLDGDATREQIAAYLEHCATAQVGMIDLGWMSWREILGCAASWTRNRLDEKWVAEVAANTPTRES